MYGDKYAPKVLADFVFANDESREIIEDIINGDLSFPYQGKTGILLYGAFGTGKSTLARLLPELIEFGKTGQEMNIAADNYECKNIQMESKVLEILKRKQELISLNASNLHYYIFDEVDELSKSAQSGLASALNCRNAVFILVTNNLSQLNLGLKDRCLLVEMNAPVDAAFLPLARRIAADMNVALNDTQLLSAITGQNGSFRNVSMSVQLLALKARRHLMFIN